MNAPKVKITGFIPIFHQKLERNLKTIREILKKEGRNGSSRKTLRLAIKEAKDLRHIIKNVIENLPDSDSNKTEYYRAENKRLKEEIKALKQKVKEK